MVRGHRTPRPILLPPQDPSDTRSRVQMAAVSLSAPVFSHEKRRDVRKEAKAANGRASAIGRTRPPSLPFCSASTPRRPAVVVLWRAALRAPVRRMKQSFGHRTFLTSVRIGHTNISLVDHPYAFGVNSRVLRASWQRARATAGTRVAGRVSARLEACDGVRPAHRLTRRSIIDLAVLSRSRILRSATATRYGYSLRPTAYV
jgi:hypothetical protein